MLLLVCVIGQCNSAATGLTLEQTTTVSPVGSVRQRLNFDPPPPTYETNDGLRYIFAAWKPKVNKIELVEVTGKGPSLFVGKAGVPRLFAWMTNGNLALCLVYIF